MPDRGNQVPEPRALPEPVYGGREVVGDAGWQIVPGRGALLAPRTVPLAFPSVSHLDERVVAAQTRMGNVDGLSEQTIAWTVTVYRIFRRFLIEESAAQPFIGGELDAQLRVLEQWIAWLRDHGRSRATVNNHWRALSLIFVRINREAGMVNPLVFLPTPKFPRREARYLTRLAAEQVLTFVQHHQWGSTFEQARNFALVGLLLFAGLRRSEATKLRFGDVNLEEGTIHVQQGKGRYGGKDRTSYMTPQLRRILSAYVVARASRRANNPAFLLSVRRDAPIGAGAVQHIFRGISRALGTSVTPHALRHTYATLLRQAGVPDRIAMDLLGHSSLQMLQRYSHVYNGEREAAAGRLVLDIDVSAA